MSNNLYMPFYWNDYQADTAHLNCCEHGAYMLLMGNYWQRGEALPADHKKLMRIAKMSEEQWEASKGLILEFFSEVDGTLRHERIEYELAKAREKSGKARESANARLANAERTLSERSANKDKEEVKEEKKDLSSEGASDPIAESPSSEIPKAKRKRSKPVYSPEFEEFWQKFPTTQTMSKLEASEQFERLDPDDQRLAMSAIPAFTASQSPGFNLHAVRYLRRRVFDGFAVPEPSNVHPEFESEEARREWWFASLKARHADRLAKEEAEQKSGVA